MVSVSTKLTEDFKGEVQRVADGYGRTVSDLLRICCEGLVSGDIRIEGDKVVCETAEPEFDFDSIIRTFRKRKYPDSAIRRYIDQICEQINEAGDYKKGVWL